LLKKWKALSMGDADPRIVLQAYWISAALAVIGCMLLAIAIIGLKAD
jgi:hypothetical protein